ncbi:MAG: 3'-5' exonuclease [Desulfobacteraceae bacterium]|jgi:DNA polymerase-3 subunit epsilon|nr:MAG: 3'-5' exonuclease [Desulfobacteraceae bacterium]
MGFWKNILSHRAGDLGTRADVSIKETHFTALDTELTGLDKKRDAIISIGAVKMVGGRIDMGKSFYHLVNPGTEMGKASIVVHEITPSDIHEKPSIDSVIREFFKFCSDDILIGHFISIDLNFLNREARRITGRPLPNPAIDTLAMVDWLKWSSHGDDSEINPENYQLHEIARGLGITPEGAHNALMDAFMTAQVFQRLIPRLEQKGISTLGRLMEVSDPSRKLKHPGMVI